MEEALTPIRLALARTNKMEKAHGDKIQVVEVALLRNSNEIASLEAEMSLMAYANKALKAKVNDLENRFSRQNIRIVGLPVGIKGPTPTEYFAKMFGKIVGESTLTFPLELD